MVVSGTKSRAGNDPATKDHDGSGGAPEMGGVAPGVAMRLAVSASVACVAALSVMDANGTAVGLVDARVNVPVNGIAEKDVVATATEDAATVAAGATDDTTAVDEAAALVLATTDTDEEDDDTCLGTFLAKTEEEDSPTAARGRI